ncbi:MAG: sigma-70 family RNA polymerase sigma factor, partial [Deltaproteobacteria bacterium]|nr:sigma-70 family RNA polymerase sigma factor [Deltaproteobacteria bacterium]
MFSHNLINAEESYGSQVPIDQVQNPGFANFNIDQKAEKKIKDNADSSVSENSPLSAYFTDLKRFGRISREREQILGKRIRKGQEIMVALTLDSPVKLKEMRQLKTEIGRWLKKRIRPNLHENEAMAMIEETVKNMAAVHPRNKSITVLSRRLTQIGHKVREAKSELINSNLRLVITIAKKYMNRGLSFADLIQEGNLGLIKAAGKYDYSRGTRFSTYASWWIRQNIIRAIYDKSRTIRIPIHQQEVRRNFFKAYYSLFIELQREPTITEIAAEMEISVNKVLSSINIISEPISLDTTLADDESYLRDHIVGDDGSTSLNVVCQKGLKQAVHENLAFLSPIESGVIKLRYGFNMKEGLTLNEVGSRFNISGERVRQIEGQA